LTASGVARVGHATTQQPEDDTRVANAPPHRALI
jgi:hypothetical protein